MKFLSNLFLKYFGPSFLVKHRTTIIAFIIGLFAKTGIPLDPNVVSEFAKSTAGLLLAVGGYLLTVYLDAKPEEKK